MTIRGIYMTLTLCKYVNENDTVVSFHGTMSACALVEVAHIASQMLA